MNNFHVWEVQKPSVDSYKNQVWKKSTFSTHGIFLKTTANPQKDHEKYMLGNLTIFPVHVTDPSPNPFFTRSALAAMIDGRFLSSTRPKQEDFKVHV